MQIIVILDLSSQQRCKINNNNDNPTSSFSIGVARNNTEDRYHTDNMSFSLVLCLIIGATSSKGDGGYEFEFLKDK